MNSNNVHREIVEAGAGCGKTTGLVARYIAALGQSQDADLKKKYATTNRPSAQASEILALTFTNEAAHQMQDRILKALLKQGSSLEARAVQEESQISTYHSFCLRLLQPMLNHLGYEGSLLTPPLAAQLRKESLLRSLADYPEANKIRKLLSLPKLIELSLKHWFHPLDSDPSESLQKSYTQFQSNFENFRIKQLGEAQSLATELAAREKKPKPDTWLHAYIRALQDPSEYAAKAIVVRGLDWIKNENVEFYKNLLAFRDFFKDKYFQSLLPEVVDEEILAQKELWKFLRWALPQSPKIFDFEAVEVEVFRALQKARSEGKRLLAPPRLILVDEFQDTNSKQYEILQIVSDESTEWYFVGDPKQSIYSFRGGDVSLFYKLRQSLTKIDKDTNYRSQPRILQFVNSLQTQLFCPEQCSEDPPPQKLHWPDNKESNAGSVNIHWLETGQSTLIYTRDLLLKNSDHYLQSSTAVLFRSWKKLYQFSELLQENGVEFRVAGSENPFHHLLTELWAHYLLSQENTDYLEGYWALDRWAHSKSFNFKTLLSPQELKTVYSHSSHSWNAQLQKFCEHIQIHRFENASKWATAMERWINARLQEGFHSRFTLSQLAQWMLKNTSSLESDNPYKISASDPDKASLTLLTLHASKGLEFKHVYLPELYERAPNHQQDGFETDEGDLLAQLEIRDDKGHKRKSLALQLEKIRSDRIKNAEEKRLLYVALTRAIETLNIVAHQPKTKSNDKTEKNSFLPIGETRPQPQYWHESLWNLGPIDSCQWIQPQIQTIEESLVPISKSWILPNEKILISPNKDFHRCGISHYLKLQESLEDDSSDSVKAKISGKVFEFASQDKVGTELHRLLELWDGQKQTLSRLLNQFDPELQPHLNEAVLAVRNLPELDLYWQDLITNPDKVQKEFELFLISDQYRLSGYADVAWFKSNNELVLIDWKSGRSLKRLTSPDRLQKFNAQLNLYATSFEQQFEIITKYIVAIEFSNEITAQIIFSTH